MTDFPIKNEIIISALNSVGVQTPLLISTISIFVVIKVIFNLLSVSGTENYSNILKDVVLVSALVFCLPGILKIMMEFPFLFPAKVTQIEAYEPHKIKNFAEYKIATSANYLTIACYWISYYLYSALLYIFICTSPFVIFFTVFLDMKGLLKGFFTLIFVICLWPLVWQGLNAICEPLLIDNGFTDTLIKAINDVFKVIVPTIIGVMAWKINPVGTVIRQLNSLVKSSTGTVFKGAKSTALMPKNTTQKGKNAINKFANHPLLNQALNNQKAELNSTDNGRVAHNNITFKRVNSKQGDSIIKSREYGKFSIPKDTKNLEVHRFMKESTNLVDKLPAHKRYQVASNMAKEFSKSEFTEKKIDHYTKFANSAPQKPNPNMSKKEIAIQKYNAFKENT